jgi:hypothetical protein
MQTWIGAVMIGIGVVATLGSAHLALAQQASKAEKQAAIRKEAQTTLTKLYTIHPSAKRRSSYPSATFVVSRPDVHVPHYGPTEPFFDTSSSTSSTSTACRS